MAPPPSTTVSPATTLIVRVVTLVCLLISVIVIATNNPEVDGGKMKFNDFYAYRYMLATGVVGIAYTFLQIAFTIYFVSTGNRLGGNGLMFLDFFGDKALSYLLATGAAAGFGLTVDLNRIGFESDVKDFLNKANAAASLLFFGFIFSVVSSIFSSFSLPKSS
ncbi:CASP-like protein PIMP1 [Salvia miltiorrhiza]|uniref:CASP-like protein PIMP1 n=1 Tax=Salvia miltiorrhiza TaxID=226208 RepID=UPI0025AD536C|nr:CASP-like protein PIMP1 [Salvia miltiorrhiza]